MAQEDRVLGLVGHAAFKVPVRVATTANITLSGLQTVDGVALAQDDRVLVKNQTDGIENGIYVADSGAWERAKDFDGPYDVVQGTLIPIYNGAGTYAAYALSTADPVIGTSSLAFELTSSVSLAGMLAASSGSSLVGFIQAGVGARATTLQTKARERKSPEDFGAIGDGTSHPLSERYASLALAQVDYPEATALTEEIDTAAINQAGRVVNAAGGGTVEGDGSKTYIIKRRVTGSQVEGGVLMRPGVNWDGNNCELKLADNCSFFVGHSSDSASTGSAGAEFTTKATVTVDVAYGDTTLTVDSSTGFTTGDDVFVRLGENATDTNESSFWMFAKVASVGGATSITLDRPVLNAVTVAAVTNAGNKGVYKITSGNFLENVSASNFYLNNDETGSANAEAGIRLRVARNIQINNVRAKNPGAGVFVHQYCENVWGHDIAVPECDAQAAHASKGRVATWAECVNCGIKGADAGLLDSFAFVAEFYCKGVEVHDLRLAQTRSSGSPIIVSSTHDSDIYLKNPSIQGYGAFTLFSYGGTTSRFRAENVFLRLTAEPLILGSPGQELFGIVQYRIGASTDEIYHCDQARWDEVMIPLKDSMSGQTFFLDYGVLCALEIFASAGVDVANDLTNVNVGRSSDNGANVKTDLVAGELVRNPGGAADVGFGTNAGAVNSFRNERLKILVTTNSSGITDESLFLLVRALLLPRSGLTRTFSDLQIQYQRKDAEWLHGEKTFDPANNADGVGETTTVTVTGAALGDAAFASFSLDLQGYTLTAYVSATNTVSVRFQNESGGALNLLSGTLRVLVRKLRP